MNEITLTASFIGGILSFFSPCIVPLLPVYFSLFSGLSITELSEKSSKVRIIFYTLIFISGFSTVYLALGAGSSAIGSFFLDYQDYLRIIGGVFLVLFGLLFIGLLKSKIFMREFRLNIKAGKFGTPVGAFFVGVGFAAGWSPCIGPILGSILIYSSIGGNISKGLKMLAMYSAGLAIPFLISSLLIDSFMKYLRKYIKLFRLINYVFGIFLIIYGLLMITGLTELL